MQLAYQVPILRIVASNANYTSDWFRVPVGSTIRASICVTAIGGVPAGNIQVRGMNTNGDYISYGNLPCAALGTTTLIVECVSEFLRIYLAQAGGVNTLTLSMDFIVSPPESHAA